jgi:diguanylate cyclase (GGDEF)-like protein
VTAGLQAITGGGDRSALLVEAVVPTLLGVFVSALMVIRLGMVAAVAHGKAAELEALRDRLAHRATHDPLTGLGNRALLTENLAGRPGRSTLLLIDLDGFKDVNDTHGHPAGDALLIEVAARLKDAAGFALVARLGGDEFAVMLPTTDRATADEAARRMVARIAEPYSFPHWHASVTASVGMLAIDGPVDPSEALRDADLALYEAKSAGKNRVVRFRPELRAARAVHTRVTAGLRDAIDRDELEIHYQPIVELATGRITAVEALLRWTPAGGEPVPPGVFIPIAEETGLIVPLGAWVLDRACAEARTWHDRYGVALTVNVSGRQLADPDLADAMLAVLASHGLPGTALIMEITESVLLGSDRVPAALEVLRRAGVRVAVDDFGTGYSSLSYLRRLPVDILKLDRSLTLASRSAEDEVITRAVLDLGEGLRLPTVAEGVESAEQAETLRAMGCPLAQGYHFARPAPAARIDALLADAHAPAMIS